MLGKKFEFHARTATLSDLSQLVILENEWPENARATEDQLRERILKFPKGFFIAEDETGIVASIICCPYDYQPNDLSNFSSWDVVISKGYSGNLAETNALYVVSGTTKKSRYSSDLFDAGVTHVVDLAKAMGKQYVVAGCLLPGYAKFKEKNKDATADEYVFTKVQERFVDPLIEKYRRLQFIVPNKHHVIANYFPHEDSLNYSALAVRNLSTTL